MDSSVNKSLDISVINPVKKIRTVSSDILFEFNETMTDIQSKKNWYIPSNGKLPNLKPDFLNKWWLDDSYLSEKSRFI